MTDDFDFTARITEPSPPSDPMYTVANAADQAAIAILLAVADVARGPVSVDDLSRLAACCRSMVAPVVAIDQPKDDARAILADVDEDIIAAYLGVTGERLRGLDDDSRTTTIQELGMLASSAPKLRAELDAANAEVQELRAAASHMDLAHINQGKQLAGAQHALRLANTQLEVANANLLTALRLQQDAPNVKMLVQGLVDLVAYWRRGGSPYDDAANAVEKILGETFANTLDQVRRERTETNEYAPLVGPEHNDVLGLRCDIRRDQWDSLRSLMINSSFLSCPRCFIVIKGRNNERGKRSLILVWRGRLKDCPGVEFEYHYDSRIFRRSHGASDWETAPVEDRWALSKYLTPLLSIARREDIVTNEIGAIVAATSTTKGEHVHTRRNWEEEAPNELQK